MQFTQELDMVEKYLFQTSNGTPIPHVDEAQMREVDRLAVDELGLSLLQMMENAGRNLALNALEMLGPAKGKKVIILAGRGGNGGGGLCAARHLRNRGVDADILLTKPASQYSGAAKTQLDILLYTGLNPIPIENAEPVIQQADLLVDALIGYSLRGAPQGTTKELIEIINHTECRVLSLDLPSGVNASTGETPGTFIQATRTLTLALPKPGLLNPASGEIFLADIGIPPETYCPLSIEFKPFFGGAFWVKLHPYQSPTS